VSLLAPVGGFLVGATYPLRALRLLAANRSLWPYVLAPIGLNVVVGLTVYLALLLAGLRGIDALVASLPDWAAALGSMLRVLLVVGLLVATGFVLVRFGVVLGSPWYGRLSERIERIERGRVPAARRGMLADVARALGHELKKLSLVLGAWALLLVVSLVPLVGPVVGLAGGLVVAATVACLDFLDPTLERRGLGFRAELGYARRALPTSAGFGLACLALTSVPFLNLLLVPLCVAGGALLVCDRPDDGRPADRPVEPTGRGR
jgi:CysZ protein